MPLPLTCTSFGGAISAPTAMIRRYSTLCVSAARSATSHTYGSSAGPAAELDIRKEKKVGKAQIEDQKQGMGVLPFVLLTILGAGGRTRKFHTHAGGGAARPHFVDPNNDEGTFTPEAPSAATTTPSPLDVDRSMEPVVPLSRGETMIANTVFESSDVAIHHMWSARYDRTMNVN
jgi:hypothetical protein